MEIQDHKEQLLMFVMKLGHYPIVLGIPWLLIPDYLVWFASNQVTFETQYSVTHCCDTPVTIQGVMKEPPDPIHSPDGEIFEPQTHPPQLIGGNIVMQTGASFFWMVKIGNLTIFKTSLCDINKAIKANDFKEQPLKMIVPKLYHQLLLWFNMMLVDWLPLYHSDKGYKLCLKEGDTPTWEPLYSMSRAQLVVLKE